MLTIKTGNALKRCEVSIDLLDSNTLNPNKMGAREFDLLVDNIQTIGFTEPVLLRPMGKRFRIVGGHHRVEAAKFLGMKTVPVVIITDPDFDDEQEEMQLLRHNTIHGKLDPQKFCDLYNKYAGKYGDEILQEMMGFAEEAEFQKLVKTTAQSLPKEMKKKFEQAAKTVKTVEGLAKLLNQMFAKYGDTLPYAYMIFDQGGQQSIWVRISKKTMNSFDVISDLCIERKRTVDDVVGGVLTMIAKGKLKDVVEKLMAEAPEVEIPDDLQVAPTQDNIDKIMALQDE